MVIHHDYSWSVVVMLAFFLYKQNESKSELTPASWEPFDLLIWPKLCGEPLKESVLPFLSPSCNCLKVSEAQQVRTHLLC